MQLQFLTGRHRSTIWKVLKRHGVSRRRRASRPADHRRYEWAEAGALLHIDAFEAAEVRGPGPLGATAARRAAQDPRGRQDRRHRRHRRPHPPGLLRAARRRERDHGLGTLRRAAAWLREQGCGPVQAVMSDNAKCYSTQPRIPRRARRARRPPHPDPALHATLEREDRAVLRHPRRRMGTRPRLAQQHHHATAPCHRSSATTTAADHTQPAAAAPPSPAFTKTASRTTSPRPHCSDDGGAGHSREELQRPVVRFVADRIAFPLGDAAFR